ncbi:MAG: hypothetical protein ABFE13_07290 [Phycisphaerales bacterium]
MRLARHWELMAGIASITLIAGACAGVSAGPTDKLLTIGGVIYTDLQDPVRSGLAGVTVTIQGDKGTFEATTGGILGLWKLDVPQGTYTVTPKKKDYAIQHLIGGWSDGRPAITIEVKPENLAANQSIQFLAVDWPEQAPESAQANSPSEPAVKPQPEAAAPESAPEPPQAVSAREPAAKPPQAVPASKTGRTGGGCATTRERSGKAGDFFTPYVAGVCVLLVRSRRDASKRTMRRR